MIRLPADLWGICPEQRIFHESLRRATVIASVMGSFAVEGFSTERVGNLAELEIEDRFRGIAGMTYFEPLGNNEELFI